MELLATLTTLQSMVWDTFFPMETTESTSMIPLSSTFSGNQGNSYLN